MRRCRSLWSAPPCCMYSCLLYVRLSVVFVTFAVFLALAVLYVVVESISDMGISDVFITCIAALAYREVILWCRNMTIS